HDAPPPGRLNLEACRDTAPSFIRRMKRLLKSNGAHRKLEGWPLLFTILTTLAILVGGIVEYLPLALVQSNVPRISSVKPFTPLEVIGRDIYIAEGCNNCHSQMVRPF